MSRPCARLAVLALPLTMASAASASDYRDLFDGKSLGGWVVEGPAQDKAGRAMWSVEDGRIVCLGEAFGFLRYDRQEFSDFTLRVEYRFSPARARNARGNSGLGIRTGRFDPKRSRETRPSFAAFEVQLMDDAGSPPSEHGTASLYRYKSPTANPARPAPEWNTIEVACAGPRITIRLNGHTVLEADQSKLADLKTRPAAVPAPKDKPRRGYVALQSHSGRVEFRKVQIREETAPSFQPGAALERIAPIFDGKSLDGWIQVPPGSWQVKDGAMASTGAGRGVLYTDNDYRKYRLFFTMRHVSGKPDHQACLLIFCTRPEPGKKALDALGGIQFQVPNGGHWDYRPGQNKSGKGFQSLPHRKFDPKEWSRVEMLVDANSGTARMAVAQPIGSRAVEVLRFQVGAAGKVGPIAWQMHNKGLFDEYKDVRIEIDPTEEELISTK